LGNKMNDMPGNNAGARWIQLTPAVPRVGSASPRPGGKRLIPVKRNLLRGFGPAHLTRHI